MRRHVDHARLASCGLLASALLGCASMQTGEDDVQAYYHAAISDAAVASPAKITPLQPLPPGPSVSVISWVTEKRLPCRPEQAQCSLSIGAERLWVTLAGEVQSLCRSWKLSGDPLRRRLEQLLGLPLDPPPQYRKAKFVMMEVPRERIERPCLGVDESNPARPTCTLETKQSNPAELRNFVGQQMAGSYIIHNPNGPGYPFTRLGYTYDWHPAAQTPNRYGASEFLIAPHTMATVTAQITTDEYCKSADHAK